MVHNEQPSMTLNRAVRGGTGRFVWLFDISAAEPVSETQFKVRRSFGRSCDARISLRRQQNGNAAQACIDLPESCASFTVELKEQGETCRCAVDAKRHDKEIANYYRRICNADADAGYGSWFAKRRTSASQLEAQRCESRKDSPLFSVITPLFNTPPAFLEALLDCMRAQTYGTWEHILVNASPENEQLAATVAEAAAADSRFKVIELESNGGIAANTNAGIAAANGDYLCFLDHDDLLEPDALHEYADAIAADPSIDLLYCDEDNVDADGSNPHIPLFKPKASPDLLYSNCYVLHWLCVSRRIIKATERTDSRYDGAQDYDLILKAFEQTDAIHRVPRVLYHWRLHEGSMSENVEGKPYAQEAGRLAIADHLARRGLKATVELGDLPSSYRTVFESTADRFTTLTVDDRTADDEEDGYAARLLSATRSTDAELVCVAAPDLADATGSFEETLAGYFQREEVGIVMPRLMQPDGLLHSMGISPAPNGALIPLLADLPAWDGGFIDFAHRPRNVAAVSPACFCMRRTNLLKNLDSMPTYEASAYVVADLCLQLRAEGKLCVYTPFAEATLTDGRVDGWNCNASDQAIFAKRWQSELSAGDPYTNPNIDAQSGYFVLSDSQ